MGLTLELYFKGVDFKNLMDRNPDAVIITSDTIPTGDGVILRAEATALDINSKPIGESIKGCPTPCHTFEEDDCLNKSASMLNLYFSKGFV